MTFPFPFNVYLCFTRIFVTLSPFRHSLCSLHQTIPLLFSLLMHPPPFYDFSHIFCLPSSPPQSVASDSTTSLLSFYFFDRSTTELIFQATVEDLSHFISLLSARSSSALETFARVEKASRDKRKRRDTRDRRLTSRFHGRQQRSHFRRSFVSTPISRKYGNDVDLAIEPANASGPLRVSFFSALRKPIARSFCPSPLSSGHNVLTSLRRMSSEVHLSPTKWISSGWKLSSSRESLWMQLIEITSIPRARYKSAPLLPMEKHNRIKIRIGFL